MSQQKIKAEQRSRDNNATGEFGTKSNTVQWPIRHNRQRPPWFPARYRLIGLVRASVDNFVLPPAIVRKATWRE